VVLTVGHDRSIRTDRHVPITRLFRLFPRAPAPHVCIDGWVFIGYIDEYGEEREASYPCRRCADS
jgi:hypothetical protein